MAKQTKKESAPKAPAPVGFAGFPVAAQLGGVALLVLPGLLHFMDVAPAQLCGVLFTGAMLLNCLAFALWPVFEEASVGGARRLALAVVALLACATVGVPLFRALNPGTPAFTASLPKSGAASDLNLAPGAYSMFVHGDFSGVGAREVRASYVVRVASGDVGRDVEGVFESGRTRGRVGRTSVTGVKAPREWNRHSVPVAQGAKISAFKVDAPLGDGIEVALHAEWPLWPFLVAAGLLSLLAAAFGATLPHKAMRHGYTGAVLTALIAGTLGGAWAWMGEPFMPLIGAFFGGVVGGYLLARLLTPAMRALPFARD